MKTKSITRYGLVGTGLLLAAVMFLPGRAMAPPPFEKTPGIEKELGEQRKKEVEPRPKVALVRISGSVRVPDGRGLGEVKIKLYEILERGGERRFVKEIKTNSAGFYSFGLGGGFLEKRVSLRPKYAQFGVGEHFSPGEDIFQITAAKMENRNFGYTGPLPDLRVAQPEDTAFVVGGSMVFEDRGGMCNLCIVVWNSGGVDSGPFKVKVKYMDHTGGHNRLKEKIKPVSSISAGNHVAVEVELGPGTAEDRNIGSLESGTGRYAVSSVRVDCENSVVESNEDNNIFPW